MTISDSIAPETEHLYRRLAETAESLRRRQVLTDFELAAAFFGVGVRMSRRSHGPVLAAEWLRDIADQLERSSGKVQ